MATSIRTLWFAIVQSLLLTTPAVAEEKRFVALQECDHFMRVYDFLNQYNEDTLFTAAGTQFDVRGQLIESGMIFAVNQDTGTWTLISIYEDATACIVASGTDFEPFVG